MGCNAGDGVRVLEKEGVGEGDLAIVGLGVGEGDLSTGDTRDLGVGEGDLALDEEEEDVECFKVGDGDFVVDDVMDGLEPRRNGCWISVPEEERRIFC